MVARPKRREKLRKLAEFQADVANGFYPTSFAAMPPVPKDAGQLPPPPGYKPPLERLPDPEPLEMPLLNAPPEQLAELVTLSLAAAKRILEMQFDRDDPDFLKKASLQKEVLASVITTQARVDQSRLRGRTEDRLGELLERLDKSRPHDPNMKKVQSPT